MVSRAKDGTLTFVIGEVHPYVFAWGSQNHFAPDTAALQAAFRADLSPWNGEQELAVVLRRRRHKGLVSDTFPGKFIEVTGKASHDPARRIAVADLEVREENGQPRLFGPTGPLTLYVGEDDHPHLRVFAPPLVEMPKVDFGAHTPRVEIGRMVYQRERWEIGQGELETLSNASGPDALAVAVARARMEQGWPRHVFVGADSEPKPLCLDLESILAQSHLQRLVGAGPLTVVEMVPDPKTLWLKRNAGAFTSELRIGMLRG
jgi:hypothetical protein